MNTQMRFGWILSTVAALSLSACTGTDKGDDTGDAGTDDGGTDDGGADGSGSGSGSGSDGGTDGGDDGGTGATATDNPFYPDGTYEGWETYELDYAMAKAGDQPACDVYWAASGTPPELNCIGCDFTFDVDMTYDATMSQDTNGDCEGYLVDAAYSYGYTSDYNGYGPYSLLVYYGYGYAFGPAAFDPTAEGDNFTYESGFEDYYYDGKGGYYPQYAGKYLTNIWKGGAVVSMGK
jgi:hypothetical protein